MSILETVNAIIKGARKPVTTTADKIAEADATRVRIQANMKRLDDAKVSAEDEMRELSIPASAGDEDARKRRRDLQAEIDSLDAEISTAARVLANVTAALTDLKAQAKAEAEAAELVERQKVARADLKRLPEMFTKAKSLRQELAALQADMRGMGCNGVDLESDDLDGQEAVAEAWLEWLAGIRPLDPMNEKLRRDSESFHRWDAERRERDRGRNQRETRHLEEAGWAPRGQSNRPFGSEGWVAR